MSQRRPAYKPPIPFSKQGLLFLPKALEARRPISLLEDHFGALYVGARDVFGIETPLPRVHEQVQRMSWKNAVFALSRISLQIHNHGVLSDVVQSQLLDGLFSQEMAARIRGAAKKARSRVFFFHRQQLLFLLKQVLLRSKEVDQPDERAEMELTLQALLMTSDVLDHDFQGKMRAGRGSLKDEDVLIWGLRNLLLNSTEEMLLQFARYYQLLLVLSSDSRLMASSDYLDVRSLFEEATGLPLVQFMATGVAFMATYRLHKSGQDVSTEKNFLIHEKTYLEKCVIGSATAEKVLNQIALTRDQFRAELAKEEEISKDDTYAFLTFRRYPLLRLVEGFLMCLAPQFLEERITGGVYWTIFDHLKRIGDEARLNRFTRFFGQLFERYIIDLCSRMIGNDRTRVISEFAYKSSKGESKTSDVMIIYPKALVLVEVVNTKINMLQTVIKGDPKSYERDARNIVIDKAKQISRVIVDFKAGRFDLGGLKSSHFDLYIPVVVTSQTFPQHFFAWSYLEEALKRDNILTGRDTVPLCIMDAEELELAEGVVQGGRDLASLLKEKARESKYRVMPFKNYLHATHRDGIPPNKEMATIFLTATDEMSLTIFGERASTKEQREAENDAGDPPRF